MKQFLLSILLVFNFEAVFSFWDTGHMLVAQVAENTLKDEGRDKNKKLNFLLLEIIFKLI